METPPSIHLHIDRLVLDGLPFNAADGAVLRAALEGELTRILADQFTDAPGDSLALDALPPVHADLSAKPAGFGREIAGALGTTLSGVFAAPPS